MKPARVSAVVGIAGGSLAGGGGREIQIRGRRARIRPVKPQIQPVKIRLAHLASNSTRFASIFDFD
jgi:hypothetical protein